MNYAHTSTIQALNASPLMIAEAVKNNPVAITVADEPIFYCVNEKLFQDFLAWQNHKIQSSEPTLTKPKKSIHDFAGILKNKTNVRLTIDELNDAIAQAGATTGMQGLET